MVVKGLILDIKGEYKELTLVKKNDYKSIQDVVSGNFQVLPAMEYYSPLTKSKRTLVCYVNEEGMVRNLDSNPWATLLSLFGVQLSCGMFIYGNVFVLSEDSHGKEANVDPYLIQCAQQYYTCEDEDVFFANLEDVQKNGKLECVTKEEVDPPLTQTSTTASPIVITMDDEIKGLKRRIDELEALEQRHTLLIRKLHKAFSRYNEYTEEVISENVLFHDDDEDECYADYESEQEVVKTNKKRKLDSQLENV
jgi:hypothetical protein